MWTFSVKDIAGSVTSNVSIRGGVEISGTWKFASEIWGKVV